MCISQALNYEIHLLTSKIEIILISRSELLHVSGGLRGHKKTTVRRNKLNCGVQIIQTVGIPFREEK